MNDPLDLPNLRGLAELAARDNVDIRPTLLRVVTDLYVTQPVHTEEEERHYTELAVRLIDLVDDRTRAAVAARLAAYPAAPAAVRQRLMETSVPDRGRDGTRGTGKPQRVADELSDLFFSADTETRRLILVNLVYSQLPAAPAVEGAAAMEAAARLEAAALSHNSEAYARSLRRSLGLSREMARRIADDPGGEPTVVVAAALDMPAAALQRVLLCFNPAIGRSVRHVYELTELHDEISALAARRMIAVWQAAGAADAKDQAKEHAKGQGPIGPATPFAATASARSGERRTPLTVERPRIDWDAIAASRKSETA